MSALTNPFQQLVRALSQDNILGGMVSIEQPRTGYRSAIDPILLAASVEVQNGESLLDVGCGVGTVSLAIAARSRGKIDDVQYTGIDKESMLVNLANGNAQKNGFENCMRFVVGDIAGKLSDLDYGRFDQVITNPPYLASDKADQSPDPIKAAANVESSADLKQWLEFCLLMLKSKGVLSMIHRADRLDEILALLHGKVGEIVIFPLWPKAGEAAKRVLLRARKDSKTPLKLAFGLVLHESDGGYTKIANDVLQNASPLAL